MVGCSCPPISHIPFRSPLTKSSKDWGVEQNTSSYSKLRIQHWSMSTMGTCWRNGRLCPLLGRKIDPGNSLWMFNFVYLMLGFRKDAVCWSLIMTSWGLNALGCRRFPWLCPLASSGSSLSMNKQTGLSQRDQVLGITSLEGGQGCGRHCREWGSGRKVIWVSGFPWVEEGRCDLAERRSIICVGCGVGYPFYPVLPGGEPLVWASRSFPGWYGSMQWESAPECVLDIGYLWDLIYRLWAVGI